MNPEKIQQTARKLRASKSLVVLTGAGVSKESGVPTFRDALDGLWAKYDPMKLGTPTLVDISTLTWDKDVEPPKCPHCGAYVRPDVVWFNEMLHIDDLARARTLFTSADVVLVVGTSGVVEPAASLPYQAKYYNEA